MKYIDRILFLLAGICLLVPGIAILGSSFSVLKKDFFYQGLDYILALTEAQPEAVVLGGIFLLLAFRCLVMAFLVRPTRKALAVQQTAIGSVTVSFTALEHLINKLLKPFLAVKEAKPAFAVKNDGLYISLGLIVMPEQNIIELTSAIQQTLQSGIKNVLGFEPEKITIAIEKMQTEKKRVE